jgi:hypothetical protein
LAQYIRLPTAQEVLEGARKLKKQTSRVTRPTVAETNKNKKHPYNYSSTRSRGTKILKPSKQYNNKRTLNTILSPLTSTTYKLPGPNFIHRTNKVKSSIFQGSTSNSTL